MTAQRCGLVSSFLLGGMYEKEITGEEAEALRTRSQRAHGDKQANIQTSQRRGAEGEIIGGYHMCEAIKANEYQLLDREEIETIISSYYWRKAEIVRLKEALFEAGNLRGGSKQTQTYGIEAAMPKGSKGISQAEYDAMDRREQRLITRIHNHAEIVSFIEIGEELVEGSLHEVVYSCMMDGMSYRAIAKHLKTNKDSIRHLRDEFLSQLSQNSQFSQNLHYLKCYKQII